MPFRNDHTFETRKAEATRIQSKYPDRIPVIVEKGEKTEVPDIDRKKFLVPKDLTMAQFQYVIRKRLKLTPEKALYLFVNNTLQPNSENICNVYRQYKDTDGFLYCVYSGESTFG